MNYPLLSDIPMFVPIRFRWERPTKTGSCNFFRGYKTYEEAFQDVFSTQLDLRCAYEIFHGRTKMAFDIDCKTTSEEYVVKLAEMKQLLEILIAETTLYTRCRPWHLVFSSHSVGEKVSFHLIVGIFCNSFVETSFLCRRIIEKITVDKSTIDMGIYRNNVDATSSLRILGCTKINKNRIKLCEPSLSNYEFRGKDDFSVFKDSLVGHIFNAIEFHQPLPAVAAVPTEVTDIMTNDVMKLIAEKEGTTECAYSLLSRISDETISAKRWINCIRKKPSMCMMCARIHEGENAAVYCCRNGKVYFMCYRNHAETGNGKVILGTIEVGRLSGKLTTISDEVMDMRGEILVDVILSKETMPPPPPQRQVDIADIIRSVGVARRPTRKEQEKNKLLNAMFQSSSI